MKRYAAVFGMFGFTAMLFIALATDVSVGSAIGRGILCGIGLAILGGFMGQVIQLQLEEMQIEEQEKSALNAAAAVSATDIYGRFRKLVMGDDGSTEVDPEAEPGTGVGGAEEASTGQTGEAAATADTTPESATEVQTQSSVDAESNVDAASQPTSPNPADVAAARAEMAASKTKEFVARVRDVTAQQAGSELSTEAEEVVSAAVE